MIQKTEKYIDYSNIPKDIRGYCDWKSSIGHFITFKYNKVSGQLHILNYITTNNKVNQLEVSYLGRTFIISLQALKKLQIGKYIGEINTWHYKINQNIQGVTIIDRIRDNKSRRNYLCQCNNCKRKFVVQEVSLDNGKINCKCNKNLYKTHPELLKYFPNGMKEMEQYSKGSHDLITPKCPLCNMISPKKIRIYNLVNYGFRCPYCQQIHISYGERFLMAIFQQANIQYQYQVSEVFRKSKFKNNRVDFLVNNIIIEVDGLIGHGNTDPFNKFGYDYGKAKDIERDAFLKESGYKVIRLNYKNSYDYKDFYNEIIIKLSNFFDLKNIDVIQANEIALSTNIYEICKAYQNHTISEISKIFNISINTIAKYLRLGTQNGWCNYDSYISRTNGYKNIKPKYNNTPCRSYNLISGEELFFDTIREASQKLNIRYEYIKRCCDKKRKTTNGYEFSYV